MSGDARAHSVALALRGRCPFCAEVTSAPGVLSSRPCAVCGGAFESPEFADRVLADMGRSSTERFWLVLAGTLLLSSATCVPGAGALVSVLGTFAAFVAVRILVVNPALALMSSTRRRIANWTVRLSLALVLALTSILLVAPGASLIGSAFALTTAWWVSRAYMMWQLRREQRSAPVKGPEYALLLGVLSVLFSAFLLVSLSIAFIWEMLSGIYSWVAG